MNWEQYARDLEKLISLMDPSPTKTLMEYHAKEAKKRAKMSK
jgi:hypothetical protein